MKMKILSLYTILLTSFCFPESFSGVYILSTPPGVYIPKIRIINKVGDIYFLQTYDFTYDQIPTISIGINDGVGISYLSRSNHKFFIRWTKESIIIVDYSNEIETGDNIYRRINQLELKTLERYGVIVPAFE